MYDLKQLKSIPLADVATRLGIHLAQKGNRLWGKLRPDERTTSFSINIKDNLWHDFGQGKGGSAIDLVMMHQGIDKTEAIKTLADMFGIKPMTYEGVRTLSDPQYRELGIHPENATLNFKPPSPTQGQGQYERWVKKYGMSVQSLADKHPEVYDKMLRSIGLRTIDEMKSLYQGTLNEYKTTFMDNNPAYDKAFTLKLLSITLESHMNAINRCVGLLESGLIQSEKFSSLKVDHLKDIKALEEKIMEERNEVLANKIVKAYTKLGYGYISDFSLDQIKAVEKFNAFCVRDATNSYMGLEKFDNILGILKENLLKISSNDQVAFKNLYNIIETGEKAVDAINEHSAKQRLPSKSKIDELELET